MRARHRGATLASSSTLNRLELGDPEEAAAHRYKRIVARPEALDDLLVGLFVGSHVKPPREIWLDLDATDDPLHGMQEGRFFHGYYRCYRYLPLYICGEHLLCARLWRAAEVPAAGAIADLAQIVGQLRRAWPSTRIVIRGDSGFCRAALMSRCEERGLDYLVGLARTTRESDRRCARSDSPRPDHACVPGTVHEFGTERSLFPRASGPEPGVNCWQPAACRKTLRPQDPRREGCRFSVRRRASGGPKPQRCPLRDTAKVEVRGEHDQVVPDTALGEKRIDRSDLNAVAPATIAQLRGLDVVLARRSDHRQRAETIQDPRSGPGSPVPLQQLLEHDAGRVDRPAPDQGLPQSRHFRSFRGRSPTLYAASFDLRRLIA